jgi:hypothetical protein
MSVLLPPTSREFHCSQPGTSTILTPPNQYYFSGDECEESMQIGRPEINKYRRCNCLITIKELFSFKFSDSSKIHIPSDFQPV